MALVAYSDESDMDDDYSDQEENISSVININNDKAKSTSINNTEAINTLKKNNKINVTESQNPLGSSIDDIVDEDDNFDTYSSTNGVTDAEDTGIGSQLSSLPAPHTVSASLDISDLDQVTDVPTVQTWKTTQDILKNKILGDEERSTSTNSDSSSSSSSQTKHKANKKKKIQFIIPALSEFSDDEEEKPEPKAKIPRSSSSGSGLFSILPAAVSLSVKQTDRPLIPHSLTKKKTEVKNNSRKSKQPTKPVISKSLQIEQNDSDEEFDDNLDQQDFFSLSQKDEIPVTTLPVTITETNKITTEINPISKQVVVRNDRNVEDHPRLPLYNENNTVTDDNTINTYNYSVPSEEASNSTQLDSAAIERLVGRKKKKEVIDFVDFSADDVLLNREEWVNKALTEEKPTHGFSNKKEGMPTKQQKRKHQITSLARQAQEREYELNNAWATNRMTRKETQSRYGF